MAQTGERLATEFRVFLKPFAAKSNPKNYEVMLQPAAI